MNEAMRTCGSMRVVTPGKLLSKKAGTVVGFFSRAAKCDEGKKRVHVKEKS